MPELALLKRGAPREGKAACVALMRLPAEGATAAFAVPWPGRAEGVESLLAVGPPGSTSPSQLTAPDELNTGCPSCFEASRRCRQPGHLGRWHSAFSSGHGEQRKARSAGDAQDLSGAAPEALADIAVGAGIHLVCDQAGRGATILPVAEGMGVEGSTVAPTGAGPSLPGRAEPRTHPEATSSDAAEAGATAGARPEALSSRPCRPAICRWPESAGGSGTSSAE